MVLIGLKRGFEFDDLGDQIVFVWDIAESLVGIDLDGRRSRKGAVELTRVRGRMADVAVKGLFRLLRVCERTTRWRT